MVVEPEPDTSLPDTARALSLDIRLHYAALVNGSNDPILSKDLTGQILSWNDAAARVFGYSPADMIGQSILRLIPPDLHSAEQERLRKLGAAEAIEPYETNWISKDGRSIPVLITMYPVKNNDGKVIGASKTACDLTERKLADESRFRLAAIVDSADDAIISKNLNSIITSWNEGACRMFGYTADEIIGKSILQLIPEELQYEEDEIVRKLRAGERIDHYETRRRKKNGDIFDISVTISPVKDASGKVIGASKIGRDISDRKRMERILIQSEKLAATGRMAATIAHEINNPLESIMNLTFLARQCSSPTGKAHQYLMMAEEELERVSHIARQTLGFYKDTGSPTEVYLHDLIENVLAVYNSKLMSTSVAVDLQLNDLQKITVSKGEMLQIFSNVIANAIDAMRHGGSLKISTRNLIGAAGDGIQIVIRDNGTGIKPEHLEKVFEPFFTTKGDLGTGIGLWVVKQLVEKRGGQISLASSAEQGNSGTAITIFIPYAIPVPRPGAAQ